MKDPLERYQEPNGVLNLRGATFTKEEVMYILRKGLNMKEIIEAIKSLKMEKIFKEKMLQTADYTEEEKEQLSKEIDEALK